MALEQALGAAERALRSPPDSDRMKNLRRVARELGEEVDDEELRAMIAEFDKDGDGAIDQKEFQYIIEKGLE